MTNENNEKLFGKDLYLLFPLGAYHYAWMGFIYNLGVRVYYSYKTSRSSSLTSDQKLAIYDQLSRINLLKSFASILEVAITAFFYNSAQTLYDESKKNGRMYSLVMMLNNLGMVFLLALVNTLLHSWIYYSNNDSIYKNTLIKTIKKTVSIATIFIAVEFLVHLTENYFENRLLWSRCCFYELLFISQGFIRFLFFKKANLKSKVTPIEHTGGELGRIVDRLSFKFEDIVCGDPAEGPKMPYIGYWKGYSTIVISKEWGFDLGEEKAMGFLVEKMFEITNPYFLNLEFYLLIFMGCFKMVLLTVLFFLMNFKTLYHILFILQAGHLINYTDIMEEILSQLKFYVKSTLIDKDILSQGVEYYILASLNYVISSMAENDRIIESYEPAFIISRIQYLEENSCTMV